MTLEVEQKYRVADPAALRAKLAAVGATFGGPIDQVDTYFAHPARDFAATDEALRLRRVGAKNCITYKGPRIDRQTKTRREIEIPFESGPASFDSFAELLTALGFKPVGAVKKTRTPASVFWRDRDVEVALDRVAGLGDFVELEIMVDASELAAAQQCVQSLAQALELYSAERRSYLELLLGAS